MALSPASPVTGATVAGFTTPTYTITADTPPNANSKQWAVTALGGTQTGVDVNTVSKPFTMTFFRPPVLKAVPQANPTTGVLKNVPMNAYKFLVRKGAQPAANQVPQMATIEFVVKVPAGTDTYEPEEIKAMVSGAIGFLSANSSGIADTVIQGVL